LVCVCVFVCVFVFDIPHTLEMQKKRKKGKRNPVT